MVEIYLRRDSRTREVAEAWSGSSSGPAGMKQGTEDHQEHLEHPSGRMWSHSLVKLRQLLNLFMCMCQQPVLLCVLVLPRPIGEAL
jgi:hypothetical protein